MYLHYCIVIKIDFRSAFPALNICIWQQLHGSDFRDKENLFINAAKLPWHSQDLIFTALGLSYDYLFHLKVIHHCLSFT